MGDAQLIINLRIMEYAQLILNQNAVRIVGPLCSSYDDLNISLSVTAWISFGELEGKYFH
jgi:hypothetical protein